MKTTLARRLQWLAFSLTTAGLCAFNGCGLSDQQLATIWSSVLTTGLNTLVSTALTTAAGG